MSGPEFAPLTQYRRYTEAEMAQRAADFHSDIQRRRTVRDFSNQPVPSGIIEDCIRAAGTAPSGANMQPWHFVAVSEPAVKRRIRIAAEQEEKEFYDHRAPQEWLDALAPLGTDPNKPFLETAPFLIVIFAQNFGVLPDGRQVKHYYATESVGIATGFLLAALHKVGLASLAHTPSPMGFLNEILDRPSNERPFLLLVVGYPEEGALVPDIRRKALEDVVSFNSEEA